MAGLPRLILFGSPHLLVDGTPAALARRKSMALLAYLCIENRPHERDSLATLLWPERGQAQAHQNLRSCLQDIGSHITTQILLADRECVSVIPGALDVDVATFLRKAAPCAGHDAEDSCGDCIPRLRDAAGLASRPFMEGFSLSGCPEFDEWQTSMGAVLAGQAASVARRLARGMERDGLQEQAAEYVRRWIASDPFDEEARRAIMRIQAKSGKFAAAAGSYRDWRDTAARELGSAPEPETEALWARLYAERRNAGSPIALFGRQSAIGEIRAALRGNPGRVVTVTGPGGVGKTSVARSIIAMGDPVFTGGCWFVDLAPVRDRAMVVSAIAASMGVSQRLSRGETLVSRIASRIGQGRILVALDNFEHLLEAVPDVTGILDSCRGLSVLATSRVPLGAPREIAIALPPLDIPPESGSLAPEDLDRFGSLALFAQRAMDANGAFRIDRGNIALAARICRRLDGLPLALELAASRLSSYTLEELDAGIAKGTRILASRDAAEPRQSSMHDAVGWSWNLLGEPARLMLRRLVVFEGGFDRESAIALCGETHRGIPTDQVLQMLVSWNLVSRAESEGRSRFRLPEATREFAAECLAGTREADDLRERHAAHFLRRAADAAPRLRGPDQLRELRLLEQDQANMVAAGEHFIRAGDAERALDLADALEWYWYRSGRLSDGARMLQAALDANDGNGVPDSAPHSAKKGRVRRALAWLLFMQGQWRASLDEYRNAVSLLESSGDTAALCRSLSGLGVAERWLGDEAGIAHGMQGIALARSLCDPLELSLAIIWVYANSGGRDTGPGQREALEEALDLGRAARDPWCEAHALNGLGDFLREHGEPDAAIICYQEALRLFRQLDDSWMIAWTLEGLGMAEFRGGRPERAVPHLESAAALFSRIGNRRDVAYVMGELGAAQCARGAFDLGDLYHIAHVRNMGLARLRSPKG